MGDGGENAVTGGVTLASGSAWAWAATAGLGALLLIVTALLWRRPGPAGRCAAAATAAAALWCLATAGAAWAAAPEVRLAWTRAAYIGALALPVAWAAYAVRRARLEPPPWLEAAFLLPALATLALLWIPAGTAWTVSVAPSSEGAAVAASVRPGPWTRFVVVPYATLLTAFGLAALAWRAWRDRPSGTGDLPAYAAAAALPATVQLAQRGTGPAGADSVAIAAGLAALILASLARDRGPAVATPNAHRAVVASLAEGVVVLDRYGRVLDLNPAAEAWLAVRAGTARGRALRSLAPDVAELVESVASDGRTETRLPSAGRDAQVRVRALAGGGERVVTLRDVSDAVRTREALRLRGALLEAGDLLHAAPDDAEDDDVLGSWVAAVGTALGAEGIQVLDDDGRRSGYRVRAHWRAAGGVHRASGTVHRYDATGLAVVAEALRRGDGRPVRFADGARWAFPVTVDGRGWGVWSVERPAATVAPADLRDAAAPATRGLAAWLARRRAEVARARAERVRSALLEMTRELLRGDASDPWPRALEAAWHAAGRPPAAALYLRGDGSVLRRVAVIGAGEAPWLTSTARAEDGAGPPEARIRAGRDAAAGRGATLLASAATGAPDGGAREVVRLQLDDPDRADAFGTDALAVAETFVAQMGAVVERLRLERGFARSERAHRLLTRVGRGLRAAESVDAYLPLLANELFGARLASLVRFGVATPEASDGPGRAERWRLFGPDGRDPEHERRIVGSGVLEAVLAADTDPGRGPGSGRAWRTFDLRAEDGATGAFAAWRGSVERVAATPLAHGDGRPGAVVYAVRDAAALDEAALRWFGQLAATIESAVARASERARRDRERATAEALTEVARDLLASRSRGDAMERVLDAAHRIVGADRAGFAVREPDDGAWRTVASVGRPSDPPPPDLLDRSWDDPRPVRSAPAPAAPDRARIAASVRGEDAAPVGALWCESRTPVDAVAASALDALAQALGSTLARQALHEHARRQAEAYRDLFERARRSEERFRLLAERVGDGVSLHEPDGRTVYLNPAGRALFAGSDDASGGEAEPPEDPRRWAHADDEDTVRELWSASGPAADDAVVRYRAAVPAPDGAERWIETRTHVVRDAEGRIVHRVATSRDVTEVRATEERLRRGALYDDLTGLANRSLLRDRLEHAISRFHRGGGRFALLFLDLDRFKAVNDELGHVSGDALLVAVAERLRECVRDADTVARFGGDEFCVLVEGADDDAQAVRTAERIQAQLTRPFHVDGAEVRTSASIGIAFARPGPAGPDRLLRDADRAMYRAKTQGKACWAIYEPSGAPDDGPGAAQRVADPEAEALHRAIHHGELRLVFQPIVRMACETVIGVEALVRWEHPERGRLLPDAFVPLAEETGLVVQLDRWVLEQGARTLAGWSRDHPAARDWILSVNLSPVHFALPDPAGSLLETVRAGGLEPTRLRLDLTERAMRRPEGGIGTALDALRAHGIRIGLEDYARGGLSLDTLGRSGVDWLRSDVASVRAHVNDPAASAAAAGLAALARGLGIDAVAEGIETDADFDAFRRLGYGLGQGRYWSEPVSAEALERRYLSLGAER